MFHFSKRNLKGTVLFSKNKINQTVNIDGGGAVSPDDFVAGTTYRGPPAVFRCLLRCLQDGAAVLHRRRLDRLLVLSHNGAGLVWAKTVGEIWVSDPRWSGRRSWTACCCSCSLGAWARETTVVYFGITALWKTWLWLWIISQRGETLLCKIHIPSRCLLWQLYVSHYCSWCSCIDT